MKKKLISIFAFMILISLVTVIPAVSYAGNHSHSLHVDETDSIGRKVNVEVASASTSNSSVVAYGGLSISMINLGGYIDCAYSVKLTGKSAGSAVVTVVASDGSIVDTITVTVSDHSWEKGKLTESTCSSKGSQEYKCSGCSVTKKDELPLVEHTRGEWVTATKPTCTSEGSEQLKCTVCSVVLDTKKTPATMHDSGTWKVKKEASCTATGIEELQCTVCDFVLQSREIAMKQHNAGPWVITKAATCNVVGSEEQRCTECSQLLNSRSIPPAGVDHTAGNWKETKAPTCNETGMEEKRCSVCNELLDSRVVPSAGVSHTPGQMLQVSDPSCTNDGKKEQKCIKCNAVIASEVLPALGHAADQWVTVKEATNSEEGLKQIACKVCGDVIDSQTIPIPPQLLRNQTVCTYGIRFRDIKPEIITDSKQWYMFTPLDLSSDAHYELPLIGANAYYVGTATVTIEDGLISVNVKPIYPAEILDGSYALIRDLDAVDSVKISQMKQYKFGKKVNIEKELGEDTNVLLYVLCRANYDTSDHRIKRFSGSSAEYVEKTEEMKLMMDAYTSPVSASTKKPVLDAANYETLEPGSNSQAVLDARIKLYKLGYFKKKPTQTEYNNSTKKYVMAFERDYGLVEDGILSPEDQVVLFSLYITLKPGSKGQEVLDARMKLYELGYFRKLPTQTEYTNNMKDYVKKFEKDYGLKQDGILSPEDQEVLFGL